MSSRKGSAATGFNGPPLRKATWLEVMLDRLNAAVEANPRLAVDG